jgi:outer membrane lipoprotein-sorting protein
MKSADDIRKLFSNAGLTVNQDADEQVFEDVSQAQQETKEHPPATPEIWRTIMRSPFAKLSVAAAVVVACLIGLSVWPSLESVALADVLARIEQIQAFTYQGQTTRHDTTHGDSVSETTVLVSKNHGMRIDETSVDTKTNEQTEMRTYFLPRERSVVLLNLTEKQYARVEMDEDTLETARIDNRDPREMIELLLARAHKDLGYSEIEGQRVQGFETTDPQYLKGVARAVRVRVWIDVETKLPVRMETEMDLAEGVHATAVEYGYQWDVTVDASEFEPQVPADFTTHDMDGMQMPSYSERGFIEALQLAHEFTGHYPADLEADTLRQLPMEIAKIITESDSPAAVEWREQIKSAGSKEAAIRYGQERMMKLTSLTMFPMILAGQGKDPVYHGDAVTPNDMELPLMRWKVSNTEYRVIFGDLHAETVTAEALAELEAALPR